MYFFSNYDKILRKQITGRYSLSIISNYSQLFRALLSAAKSVHFCARIGCSSRATSRAVLPIEIGVGVSHSYFYTIIISHTEEAPLGLRHGTYTRTHTHSHEPTKSSVVDTLRRLRSSEVGVSSYVKTSATEGAAEVRERTLSHSAYRFYLR